MKADCRLSNPVILGMIMRQANSFDIFRLVSIGIIWGSAFIAIKIAVGSLPPSTVAAMRIFFGATALYTFIRLSGHRLPRETGIWKLALLVSVFSSVVPFTLISWGERHLDSGLTAILMATGPLIALVLSHFTTTDDRFTLWKFVGVVMGLCGVLVVIGVDVLSGVGSDVLAQLAIVSASFCYSVGGVLTRRLTGVPTDVATTLVLICGGALAVPIALVVDRPWTLDAQWDSLAAVLYLGLFPTALAYIIRFRMIMEVGYTFVSFAGYLVPVFGVILGALILGERFGVEAFIALALILAGVAVSRKQRKGVPEPGSWPKS